MTDRPTSDGLPELASDADERTGVLGFGEERQSAVPSRLDAQVPAVCVAPTRIAFRSFRVVERDARPD